MNAPTLTGLNPLLGQVWTPDDIALDMARQALRFGGVFRQVLDPASGPGTFSKALHRAGLENAVLTCYDIDTRMAHATRNENRRLGFSGVTHCDDYLLAPSGAASFDLVIMNPPYVRQELIPVEKKQRYHQYLSDVFQCRIDRRSNLFVLFLLKAMADLAPGGVLCAIVYDAVTHTAYGKSAMALLELYGQKLTEQPIKAPFEGVLVDARILVFKKRNKVDLVAAPVSGHADDVLVPLEQLLAVRRGTAMPRRKSYLASLDDPFYDQSAPFFIKQATLDGLVIKPDTQAYFSGDEALLAWLGARAHSQGHKLGKAQLRPVRAPIAFNYYIRKAPRHLWNAPDVALADNFYASHTTGGFPAQAAWLLLNSDAYLERLVAAARNQGSGLLKLQLYEYKQVRVPDWRNLPASALRAVVAAANQLIAAGAPYPDVRSIANGLTQDIFPL